MKYNPEKHHRRSIRLKGYDYSSNGAYFITLCAQNREYFFGNIIDAEMVLNDAGLMIERWYNKLPDKFPGIELDEYMIMPDHFHCIIVIDRGDSLINTVENICNSTVGANPSVRPEIMGQSDEIFGQALGPARTYGVVANADIPRVMQWFKTMTTNEYIRGVKTLGWLPFNKRMWQRNYYEHIIRNDGALNRIREYIINNPRKWNDNKNNAKYVFEPYEIYGSAPVGAHPRVCPKVFINELVGGRHSGLPERVWEEFFDKERNN